MTISPVTYSVFATPGASTYISNTAHGNTESISDPLPIGNLEQQGNAITVSDQGSSDGTQTYNFTAGATDNIYLGLAFNNVVDQETTHIQLFDSSGNLIADNEGTASQQAVYDQLTAGGYTPGAGNYSLQVTPAAGLGSSADVSISALQQQGTALSVNSQLTPDDPAQYYSFSLYNSQNMKMAFNSSANSAATRIQIYDSSGNLVADNRGDASQQAAFAQLTSGSGISANAGDYTLEVSYAPNTGASSQSLNYNFQLYSGTDYSVVYQTNATAATGTNTAEASVTPSSNAQAYGKQSYHAINETAQSGVAIGYLNQNQTALNVTSLLTPVDSTDYYNFILQGNSTNIKVSLSNLTDASSPDAIHFQLLNAGGQVIADNQGTTAQQEAFTQLTSGTGITGTPGSYFIRATYAAGANKAGNLQYGFNVYSGTTYSALYRTTASAQTYENAVLSGDIGNGFSAASATAAYIAGGFSTSIFGSTSTTA